MVIPNGHEGNRVRDVVNVNRIVVAYDGGASSEAALEWAERYAHISADPLTLIYVDDG